MTATAIAAIMALSGPELPPRLCPVAAIEHGVTLERWQAVRAVVEPIFAGGLPETGHWRSVAIGHTETRRAVTPADPPPPIPPIPLPASLWLLLSGIAALVWRARA